MQSHIQTLRRYYLFIQFHLEYCCLHFYYPNHLTTDRNRTHLSLTLHYYQTICSLLFILLSLHYLVHSYSFHLYSNLTNFTSQFIFQTLKYKFINQPIHILKNFIKNKLLIFYFLFIFLHIFFIRRIIKLINFRRLSFKIFFYKNHNFFSFLLSNSIFCLNKLR